jgi:hypothetical protein
LPEGSSAALRRWRDLCDELEVDLVVDVVTGTSAGGLDGALLACAIAADRPLRDPKELWVETAQLERSKLLGAAGGTRRLVEQFGGAGGMPGEAGGRRTPAGPARRHRRRGATPARPGSPAARAAPRPLPRACARSTARGPGSEAVVVIDEHITRLVLTP